MLKGVTSVCESPPRETREYKPRRVPRLTVSECAVDLLTLRCDRCDSNCFDSIKLLPRSADVMASRRVAIVESGQRRSSELLFDMLLPYRIVGKNKMALSYVIEGLHVCGDAWFLFHGLDKKDSRVKRVLSCLRRGDNKWSIKSNKRKRGADDSRGLLASAWMRKYVKDYADKMPTVCLFRIDPVDRKELHHKYERRCTLVQQHAISYSRFCELWKEMFEEGVHDDGILYKVQLRPGVLSVCLCVATSLWCHKDDCLSVCVGVCLFVCNYLIVVP